MTSREVRELDPNNIIDSNAHRTTRERASNRISSTMIATGSSDRAGMLPGISPIRESNSEPRPPDSSPVFTDDNYVETLMREGRGSLSRESCLLPGPRRAILSSTDSDTEVNMEEAIIKVRQDVDRFVNHLDKALDWKKKVISESTKITVLIAKTRDAALASIDSDSVSEFDKMEKMVKRV